MQVWEIKECAGTSVLEYHGVWFYALEYHGIIYSLINNREKEMKDCTFSQFLSSLSNFTFAFAQAEHVHTQPVCTCIEF